MSPAATTLSSEASFCDTGQLFEPNLNEINCKVGNKSKPIAWLQHLDSGSVSCLDLCKTVVESICYKNMRRSIKYNNSTSQQQSGSNSNDSFILMTTDEVPRSIRTRNLPCSSLAELINSCRNIVARHQVNDSETALQTALSLLCLQRQASGLDQYCQTTSKNVGARFPHLSEPCHVVFLSNSLRPHYQDSKTNPVDQTVQSDPLASHYFPLR
ncbi:MAG: hypothetical protein MHPSP_000919, partial [Paramarteilia canceri]